MDISELNQWVSEERQTQLIERLLSSQEVGLTKKRAIYLVRLCIYVCVQQRLKTQPDMRAPLTTLLPTSAFIVCTHKDAAGLFYGDQDQGDERAAGLMLKTLDRLGFIEKRFLGNETEIKIHLSASKLQECAEDVSVTLKIDDFHARDAVPISMLLAERYNWMNRDTRAIPNRIARLLRQWARDYSKGMRVLRREDNQSPVGFYLLHAITADSELIFSRPPIEGLHLGSLRDEDPFTMALPGDEDCQSIFVRSWVIERDYQQNFQIPFLQDVQMTLMKMREDFPNLADLWTLIIHPTYGRLSAAVGFQRLNRKTGKNIYWVYQSLDRFLELNIERAIRDKF